MATESSDRHGKLLMVVHRAISMKAETGMAHWHQPDLWAKLPGYLAVFTYLLNIFMFIFICILKPCYWEGKFTILCILLAYMTFSPKTAKILRYPYNIHVQIGLCSCESLCFHFDMGANLLVWETKSYYYTDHCKVMEILTSLSIRIHYLSENKVFDIWQVRRMYDNLQGK